jgi:hypothetical protein
VVARARVGPAGWSAGVDELADRMAGRFGRIESGRRWTVEESFQGGTGLAGLDEHQVRRWLPWRRWTLLAMLAHALLVVLAAGEHAAGAQPRPG